ncbi:MAG TPA: peptidylprolyl isomerase [Opitutaceae bacterium]|nr:peptidylprolyl isomerase [Opitutaceae bacterium]
MPHPSNLQSTGKSQPDFDPACGRTHGCAALNRGQSAVMLSRARLGCLALLASVWVRATGPEATPVADGLYAEFTTPRGVIVAELYDRQAPLAVTSFVGLAEGTLGPAPRKPFFNGLTFHRVVPDFVAQGGDPLGTGEGGPGYTFPDEFAPGLHHEAAGVLSLANDGPDTNGSQFFFTLRETNRLNYLHTVFGRVVCGLDVLARIVQGDAMQVRILRIGVRAQGFRADDQAFAALLAATPKYAGQPAPGPTAPFDDPDHLLPADPPRAKNFNYKLANFERATGLRLAARVFRTFQPEAAGQTVNAFRGELAHRLGVDKRGALALYFADRDLWTLWIGDEQLPVFNPAGLKLHARKLEFIAAARSRASEAQAYAQRINGPDHPLTDGQRLKLFTDEILDGLISLFEPKPAAPPP